MTPTTEELVNRLRESCPATQDMESTEICDNYTEAADTIESLAARVVALEERLAKAESFRLGRYLTVQHRGDDRWAVVTIGMVVNPDLEEEYEPNPSSRTDEFIERTRYSLDEAFSIAEAFAARAKMEELG